MSQSIKPGLIGREHEIVHRNALVEKIWNGNVIIVSDNDSQQAIQIVRDAPDELIRFNGHGACRLKVGMAVTYSIQRGSIFNVKFPEVKTVISTDEFEISQIVDLKPGRRGGFGFVARQCKRKCRLFFAVEDVLTTGAKIGAWCQHKAVVHNDGRMKAVEISVFDDGV